MPRKGTTLIEVLIAIFIMALGLIALLTLFPIGAVQMARAIQDERSAQVAANSAAYFRWYWKTLCENEHARLSSLPSAGSTTVMFPCDAQGMLVGQEKWFTAALDDPNLSVPSSYQKNTTLFPTPVPTSATQAMANVAVKLRESRPSYPVLIDPVGWEGAGLSASERYWVGSAPAGMPYAIPRRTMPNLAGKPITTRMCYLLDDMTFFRNGTAVNPDVATPSSPPPMERPWKDSSYSCAYLVKRENNSDRGRLNLTVIVYAKKSIDATPNEPAYTGIPQVGIIPGDPSPTVQRPDTVVWGNTVTLTYTASQEAPPVPRGTWILDATIENDTTAVTNYDTTGRGITSQGYFYRVTEVLERTVPSGSTPGSVVVQLEGSLKPGKLTGSTPNPRLFVIPDGILDVFDKGTLDPTSPPRVN